MFVYVYNAYTVRHKRAIDYNLDTNKATRLGESVTFCFLSTICLFSSNLAFESSSLRLLRMITKICTILHSLKIHTVIRVGFELF